MINSAWIFGVQTWTLDFANDFSNSMHTDEEWLAISLDEKSLGQQLKNSFYLWSDVVPCLAYFLLTLYFWACEEKVSNALGFALRFGFSDIPFCVFWFDVLTFSVATVLGLWNWESYEHVNDSNGPIPGS